MSNRYNIRLNSLGGYGTLSGYSSKNLPCSEAIDFFEKRLIAMNNLIGLGRIVLKILLQLVTFDRFEPVNRPDRRNYRTSADNSVWRKMKEKTSSLSTKNLFSCE